MRKLSLILLVSLLSSFTLMAQSTAKGVVKDAGSGNPISGVKITFLQQNISTLTNVKGEFTLSYLKTGNDEVSFSREGYLTQIKLVNLKTDVTNDLGIINLKADIQDETKQEMVIQLSETDLNVDEGRSTQNMSSALSSKGDVYTSQTSYSFSPMRFRTRGYENKYESTYINGVHFTDAERGSFNYSSLGGLNNAFRNKDMIYGYDPNSFSYGSLGSSTNIMAKASQISGGSNANLAFSNRAYKIRGQFTYGTGVLNNGWAFAVSGVVRWANDEGILKSNVDGGFYNSGGLFLSADKIINEKHAISLSVFGAPTRRTSQAAITGETHDLIGGSVYYNPYWGYQNGKIRNSRIVKAFDPTVILSHDWKITSKQRLRTGLGFHHSWYSNSAFSYDGTNPSPDYYRNMPSFVSDDNTSRERLTNLWKTDKTTQQVNWDEFYLMNQNNNTENPNGQAKYILERRHNDLMEGILNSVYTNEINKNIKLTAGVEARMSKGMHYVTIDDLLGANQYIDKDTYAERDLVGGTLQDADTRIIQNDLNNPNRIAKQGDVIRYNYDMNVKTTNAFAQADFNYSQFNFYLGAKATSTDFYRYGHMDNGRAWYLREIKGQDVNSYGKSKVWYFVDPSVKGGFSYKIDNRNKISFNVSAETQAPLVQDAYVSERIKDVLVPNIESEKIVSFDLNYNFNYKFIRGRLSGFRTQVSNALEKYGYFDDGYKTFINHLLSGVDKRYQGIELGLSLPVNSMITVSTAGTLADYSYTGNATGIKSYENGAENDVKETVMTKGLKINAGPQLAANFSIDIAYNLWFFNATLNYFNNNYMDFAPNRFTQTNYGNLPASFYESDNLSSLQQQCMDDQNKFSESKFNTLLNEKNFKSKWGLSDNESANFGAYYGNVIKKDASGKVVGLGISEARQKLATQEKLKGGFMLDASIGKLVYLKNRRSLNFNLSVSNILNNTSMITGGYQQARIPMSSGAFNAKGLDWFANKYYYAWGINVFFHVGYKF